MLTYGLNRSPILAHFQKGPKTLMRYHRVISYLVAIMSEKYIYFNVMKIDLFQKGKEESQRKGKLEDW